MHKPEKPYILGCGLSDHESSTVLMHGDEIVVGIPKERVTRIKRHGCTRNDFDNSPVSYCLETADIGIDDVDLIVQNSVFSFLSNPLYYQTLNQFTRSVGCTPRLIDLARHPVTSISHHLAHAYCSYFLSPFDEALVLIIDSMGNEDFAVRDFFQGVDGEWLKTTGYQPTGGYERESVYLASKGELTPLWKRFGRNDPPNGGEIQGLGTMYHFVSEYIFGNGHEAGQTMGLAPFGDAAVFAEHKLVDERPSPDFFSFRSDWLPHLADAWSPKNDPERKNWESRREEFANLAARVQHQLEESVLSLCRHWYKETGIPNLCIAGGVGLNCVLNKQILEETPFTSLFVPPASGDTGIAMGCAMYGYKNLGGKQNKINYRNDGIGRSYSPEKIEAVLKDKNVSYTRLDSPHIEAARRLSKGQIIGWFQGGSEFGPRALGHRSLLCAPSPEGMRDILNQRVKHRASFRPFAPSVLEEHAHDYFELDTPAPFMLRVAKIRPERLDEISATSHVDGTARVQTVNKDDSPLYHALISAYADISGIPVVLNTSFNDADMPIVESPEDALNCFLAMDIDALFLGQFLVKKE